MYVIHAPGGHGYYLVENTDGALSTHTWHHGNYGLQAARKFRSKAGAQAIMRAGFKDAGGHPAQIYKVTTRPAYCATTQGGQRSYWLCPGLPPYPSLLRWRASSTASCAAQRFSTPQSAQEATQGVRLPAEAGKVKIVRASENILVKD